MAYAFIPFRLDIKQAPQYTHFPRNVLFAATKVVDGKLTAWTALYVPDLSSYTESNDGSAATMLYYNRVDRDWHIAISWKNIDGQESYTARKYSPMGSEPVLVTNGGGDWDKFFTHLTIIGLTTGETCEISPV